jgi:hypothetical protein
VGLNLTIKGSRDLHDVAHSLKRAKGVIRQELAQGLKRSTDKGAAAAKRAILALQIRGFRTSSTHRFHAETAGGHIRSRIARVIESKVSTSSADPVAAIQVRSDRLGNARNVPYHLDSARVFRHPIMGDREHWAGTRGGPWFYTSVDRGEAEKEADAAIGRAAQRLESGK